MFLDRLMIVLISFSFILTLSIEYFWLTTSCQEKQIILDVKKIEECERDKYEQIKKELEEDEKNYIRGSNDTNSSSYGSHSRLF